MFRIRHGAFGSGDPKGIHINYVGMIMVYPLI